MSLLFQRLLHILPSRLNAIPYRLSIPLKRKQPDSKLFYLFFSPSQGGPKRQEILVVLIDQVQ